MNIMVALLAFHTYLGNVTNKKKANKRAKVAFLFIIALFNAIFWTVAIMAYTKEPIYDVLDLTCMKE